MSLIAQYAAYEQELRDLQEKMKNLENKDGLKEELAFKEALDKLLDKHQKSPTEVIDILAPKSMKYRTGAVRGGSSSLGKPRKPRSKKIYKNPHTSEVVETFGGNNKTLREWKSEFGDEEVASWVVRVEEPANQAQQ